MCINVCPCFCPILVYITLQVIQPQLYLACPILFKWQWNCRVSHKPANVLSPGSSSLFTPAKRRASTWMQPKIVCPPLTAASAAKSLSALRRSLLSCQPLFPSDWLSWHFLTVSVNHLTVTEYHYGAGRAWTATWCNNLSLMLHHVIYIEMAKLLRSGRVNGCYNSKWTRRRHAGGECSLWPMLRLRRSG